MRKKIAIIVIAIAVAITSANFGFSLVLTRQSLTEIVSKDIILALDIANDSISTRISLYQSNAQIVAERLMNMHDPIGIKEALREQIGKFPDFIAFTVFDRQGIVAEYGDLATSANLLNNSKYISSAFEGKTVISTTRYSEDTGELVMHVCAPMDPGRVLSVTIPGQVFSNELAKYKLWDTGNIWMVDEVGDVIAHYVPEIAYSRINFYQALKQSSQRSIVEFFEKVLSNDNGFGVYVYDGIEYHCAYKRVSAPETDWHLGLSVPLAESPVARVQNVLILLSVFFLVIANIAAVLSSKYLAKPYDKVAEQNRRLEEFSNTTQAQANKIKEVLQRAQLMMDAMPVCSMLWDRDGRIFECNEEAVKLFKMKDKDDFLSRFFDLSPVRQPGGQLSETYTKTCIGKAFEQGTLTFEWMHQLLDGTPIPCEITLVRVDYDEGHIVAAYMRDLRKQKQMMAETFRLQTELEVALKEAQDANRAKSSFLATMSHEMRTPLNAIIGLTELILNTESLPGEAQERLNNVYVSGMTLLGIVNDILDLSKIESGKLEMHPAQYDTPSLINDIVSLNIVRIGEKPVKFSLAVDEGLPQLLYGDDLRVKQVFNNLLSNAFKYTNAGTVTWSVSSERDGDSVWLVSSVKDTGIGIKPEDQQKLFRDYSQVDAQTNRKVEGAGLGLAITKHLVDMMDGTITVESDYGKGSTFSVRLRQYFETDAPIGKDVAENLANTRLFASRRAHRLNFMHIDLSYAHVLIVDDVQANLDVVKGMLKPYKIHVECASSGRQAIDMVRAGKPQYDAIFMDHMMPGMDGIEVTRAIRNEIGTYYARNVPVIALTANAIAGNEKMFLDNGFQAFISKPIDIMRLDSVLRQWVRSKEYEKEYEKEFEKGYEKELEKGYGVERGYLLPANHGLGGGRPPLGGAEIDGLDADAGLKRFSGDEATYAQVLQSYVESTRQSLGIMMANLQEGDLVGYVVAAHGVKGASFGVGAMQAGNDAERLEKLAEEGETEKLLAGNGAFVEDMERLLSSIEGALSKASMENIKPVADRPDQALLQELRDACGKYDVRKVDEAMRRLDALEYKNGAGLVAWLRSQADDMNFDEIAGGDWPPV